MHIDFHGVCDVLDFFIFELDVVGFAVSHVTVELEVVLRERLQSAPLELVLEFFLGDRVGYSQISERLLDPIRPENDWQVLGAVCLNQKCALASEKVAVGLVCLFYLKRYVCCSTVCYRDFLLDLNCRW